MELSRSNLTCANSVSGLYSVSCCYSAENGGKIRCWHGSKTDECSIVYNYIGPIPVPVSSSATQDQHPSQSQTLVSSASMAFAVFALLFLPSVLMLFWKKRIIKRTINSVERSLPPSPPQFITFWSDGVLMIFWLLLRLVEEETTRKPRIPLTKVASDAFLL